jgi:molybdenum storage protein
MEPRLIDSLLRSQSLTDREVIQFSHADSEVRMVPDANVLKLGGQSIMDRGRATVYPLLEEIVRNKPHHKMVLGAGGGTRARHAYQIAMDLDMPTGLIAKMGAAISRQNARMLHMLLAKHGGVHLVEEQFELIPLFMAAGCLPILHGMPPYEYWERPPMVGRVPDHRTDVGVFLVGEVLGARSVIFIKDEDGLYTADPKKNPRVEFIPKISAQELMRRDFHDIVIERRVLELLPAARHIKQVQIVNGLKPGTLTRALDGEHVGTIIYDENGPRPSGSGTRKPSKAADASSVTP